MIFRSISRSYHGGVTVAKNQFPLPLIAITLHKCSRTYVPPEKEMKDGRNEF